MVRIIALLAALAGLTAMGAQAFTVAVDSVWEAQAHLLPLAYQVGQMAQLAFVLLVTLFLLFFSLSKRVA